MMGAQVCAHVGKLCSIWQDFSKSRCRFTVLVLSKLTGICRERFLILCQLKIKLVGRAELLSWARSHMELLFSMRTYFLTALV